MSVSIGYLTLGAADLEAAVAFYDAVLPAIGWARFNRHPGFAGYGPNGSGEGQTLWLCKRGAHQRLQIPDSTVISRDGFICVHRWFPFASHNSTAEFFS